VELDPICQDAWVELAAANFFARDKAGFHAAIERGRSLNPLNVLMLSYGGVLLALSGEWERGLQFLSQAMALNPHHADWLHFVPFYHHFRLQDYESALVHVKRINMPWFQFMHADTAAVAGQLGRVAEAEAALTELARTCPRFLDPATAHARWTLWIWDAELVDRLMDGLRKAIELAPEATRQTLETSRDSSSENQPPT
jgi:tetratricopeptide (TPR) repeat protein